MTAKRLWLLDVVRGAALVNMLAYHALYDWVYVFGHASSWYDINGAGCHVWQQYICWSFILVSGYSFTLARKPWKNGLLVAGCAVILTVVTVGFMPSESIWFGVLHLNGVAVLLSWLVRPLLEKCPPGVGLAVCALLFALTNQVPRGYLGFETLRLWALPDAWYRPNWFWLGLPDLTRFSSADYFPLIPWLFLFWCGLFLARLWRPRAGQAPAVLRPLALAGRHTLLVYMLHQPVIYVALWLWHAVC